VLQIVSAGLLLLNSHTESAQSLQSQWHPSPAGQMLPAAGLQIVGAGLLLLHSHTESAQSLPLASESCWPDASCSRAADRGCRALVLAFTQRIRAACHVHVILGCPRLCGFARIHSPPCLPLLHIVSPAASPSCLFGALVFCSCGFKAHGIISIVYWAHCKRIPRLQTLTCSESRVQTLTCSESRVFMAIVSGCPRLARRLAGAAL
jgi:hypothetical protein